MPALHPGTLDRLMRVALCGPGAGAEQPQVLAQHGEIAEPVCRHGDPPHTPWAERRTTVAAIWARPAQRGRSASPPARRAPRVRAGRGAGAGLGGARMIAITVDVHGEPACRTAAATSRTGSRAGLERVYGVRHGLPRILRLLDELAVQATFYVPGVPRFGIPPRSRPVAAAGARASAITATRTSAPTRSARPSSAARSRAAWTRCRARAAPARPPARPAGS